MNFVKIDREKWFAFELRAVDSFRPFEDQNESFVLVSNMSRSEDFIRLADQLCVLKEKPSLTKDEFQSMLLKIYLQQSAMMITGRLTQAAPDGF